MGLNVTKENVLKLLQSSQSMSELREAFGIWIPNSEPDIIGQILRLAPIQPDPKDKKLDQRLQLLLQSLKEKGIIEVDDVSKRYKIPQGAT